MLYINIIRGFSQSRQVASFMKVGGEGGEQTHPKNLDKRKKEQKNPRIMKILISCGG